VPVVFFQEQMVGNATQDVSLAPFDRFGGGGGRVRVRATLPSTATTGDCSITVMVGSDVLISSGPLSLERAAGEGPDDRTAAVSGIAAPGDPITVRIINNTAGTPIVTGIVDVQNA